MRQVGLLRVALKRWLAAEMPQKHAQLKRIKRKQLTRVSKRLIDLRMNETPIPPTEPPKKTLQDHIAKLLADLDSETKRVTRLVAWLQKHKEQIEQVGTTPKAWCEYIDFDHPSREQILAIIKAFPGRWEKTPNYTSGKPTMNYEQADEESGLTIRIWSGALPPTCRLIEEEVDVPARKERRIRLECKPAETEAA